MVEALRGDDLPHPSFPKSFIGNPSFCFSFFCFKHHGPLIEPFRGDEEVVFFSALYLSFHILSLCFSLFWGL